jgi:ArsR family transcriptional regulator, arsenate/arsenite/antimonite-responsive transcriptional repressor
MRIKNFSLSFGTQLFKAFSDESRVRILALLYHNKQMCISDLEHILDFTQTKTSRHLIYLKNSGIVSQKKLDRWVFYFIKDEVYDLVNQLFQFMEKDSILQKDQEMYRILYSNRELALNKLQNKKWLRENI